MKFLSIIQKIVKVAIVLIIIAISLFFAGAVYELILVGIELLSHGARTIDMDLITHALEHVVHFVANGILLLFVFRYLRHELHDGTPYTAEGAKELQEIGIHTMIHPVITGSIITIIYVACGKTFPAFFTEGSFMGVILGFVLIFVSLMLRYGAELEKNKSNNDSKNTEESKNVDKIED